MRPLLVISTIVVTVVMMDTSGGRQSQSTKNPFAPLSERTQRRTGESAISPEKLPAAKTPELRLNGIIWTKDNPLAIINDAVVSVGGEAAGRKVVAIATEHVELEYQRHRLLLRITPKILFDVTPGTPTSEPAKRARQ